LLVPQGTPSTTRKRTKAETLAGQIGAIQNKIGDLDFPSLSTEDREMLTETLNSLKGKFWHENFSSVVYILILSI
jgi:hypothetical protein